MLTALLVLAATAVAAPQPVYIKAGTLIDGRADAPRTNQVIVVRGNRIESVGGDVAVPAGAKAIDLSGMTVLPGMIDSPTHIFLHGEDPPEGRYDVQQLKCPLAYRAACATVAARPASEQGFD